MNKSFQKPDRVPVVVWGASGQAKVVTDILSSSNEYVITAYFDDVNVDPEKDRFADRPLLHHRDELKKIYSDGVNHAIIAIGNIQVRKRLVPVLKDLGFTFINAVHKSAIISETVKIGSNVIIKPGVIIDPDVNIGDHSYIGSGVIIGHDCKIGNFVNITGGSKIAGHVQIHDEVYIGTGVAIIDRITIGMKSIIGIGSVVVSDIPANSKAKGIPARID